MTFKKHLVLLLCAMLIFSCASESTEESPSTSNEASFTVIGETTESVFQLDYVGSSQTEAVTNLSDVLGITPNYLTFRQNNGLLSFYSFRDGFFTLSTLDLSNSQQNEYLDFYENIPERSVAWGTNTASHAYFAYFAGQERET